MKKTKTVIPSQTREDINQDDAYKVCMLYGWHGHECGGRLTKEHALIVGGKTVQTKSAIISLCAKGHDVDQFQDSHNMVKELNEWVAYCRMSDNDLLSLCGDHPGTDPNLSKSRSHFQKKSYLIGKYGVWEQKLGYKADPVINVQAGPEEDPSIAKKVKWNMERNMKKMWYAVPEHLQDKVKSAMEAYKKVEGENIELWQMIDKMIEEYVIPVKEIKGRSLTITAFDDAPINSKEIDWSLVGIPNKQ